MVAWVSLSLSLPSSSLSLSVHNSIYPTGTDRPKSHRPHTRSTSMVGDRYDSACVASYIVVCVYANYMIVSGPGVQGRGREGKGRVTGELL